MNNFDSVEVKSFLFACDGLKRVDNTYCEKERTSLALFT